MDSKRVLTVSSCVAMHIQLVSSIVPTNAAEFPIHWNFAVSTNSALWTGNPYVRLHLLYCVLTARLCIMRPVRAINICDFTP